MGGVVTDKTGAVAYSNFTDSIKLYDWGFENYETVKITDTAEILGSLRRIDADRRRRQLFTVFSARSISLSKAASLSNSESISDSKCSLIFSTSPVIF